MSPQSGKSGAFLWPEVPILELAVDHSCKVSPSYANRMSNGASDAARVSSSAGVRPWRSMRCVRTLRFALAAANGERKSRSKPAPVARNGQSTGMSVRPSRWVSNRPHSAMSRSQFGRSLALQRSGHDSFHQLALEKEVQNDER
jgi:hypothetical protein